MKKLSEIGRRMWVSTEWMRDRMPILFQSDVKHSEQIPVIVFTPEELRERNERIWEAARFANYNKAGGLEFGWWTLEDFLKSEGL